MNNQETKTFVATLAEMTPEERATAWRKLTPTESTAAWAALTPEEREADARARQSLPAKFLFFEAHVFFKHPDGAARAEEEMAEEGFEWEPEWDEVDDCSAAVFGFIRFHDINDDDIADNGHELHRLLAGIIRPFGSDVTEWGIDYKSISPSKFYHAENKRDGARRHRRHERHRALGSAAPGRCSD
jgi:hypothetical protein